MDLGNTRTLDRHSDTHQRLLQSTLGPYPENNTLASGQGALFTILTLLSRLFQHIIMLSDVISVINSVLDEGWSAALSPLIILSAISSTEYSEGSPPTKYPSTLSVEQFKLYTTCQNVHSQIPMC